MLTFKKYEQFCFVLNIIVKILKTCYLFKFDL